MTPLERIVETALYTTDLDAAEQFYARVLGLERMGREPGRHIFFRVGDSSMLLLFDPRNTLRGEMLPSHGTTGPGHLALGVSADSLPKWREHLTACSIDIEKEVDWPRGGKSIYFRDPAGNSVEILTPGIWGLPSGW